MNRPLRIVQAVGWYFPDSLGGTEVYVASLAASLRARGHDVSIAAPEPGLARERSYLHDDLSVYRYPIPAAPTRDEARGEHVVRGAEQFHRWLATTRPDVVHFHTFVTGLGVLEVEAAHATGARVVVTTHSASLGFICARGTLLQFGRTLCDGLAEPVKCAACALEQRGLPRALATVVATMPSGLATVARTWPGRAGTTLGFRALIESNIAMQRRLFQTISAFVVLSDWAAAVVIANGAPPEKVIVNRLGIRSRDEWCRKPSPALKPSRPPITAGFVGRAEAVKGLDDAVRAVTSLAPGVPVRLRVIAPAASSAERRVLDDCRRLAAGDPRIVFEPPVAPDLMPRLLADLDLLICPSRVVEGGPTVALEALAVGTPVIAANVPALSEIIEDGVNGALYPPGDWKTLAEWIGRVAADPLSTIDRWRSAAHTPRTMDEVAAEYLELYARGA